jgi:hypothetical protein
MCDLPTMLADFGTMPTTINENAQALLPRGDCSMKDFSFMDVLGLMRKTAPFLIFRFLIYFAITLCFVLITGTGAGVGYGIGYIANNAPAGGMWGGLVGFGVASAISVSDP